MSKMTPQQGAYWKGHTVGSKKKGSKRQNPYSMTRGSAGFHNAWLRGFEAARTQGV